MGSDTENYVTYNPEKDILDYKFDYNTEETDRLRHKLKETKNITIDILRQISLWKLNRVLNVSDDLLGKLTALAKHEDLKLEDESVKEIIKLLVDSDGIGYPMASTILKFIRPDVFPIIDTRAYRVLTGKKISYNQYNYETYINYAKKITEIAEKKGMKLYEVDEQLYSFDKDKNKKI